ncbi:pantoate-beta-alanine ligase [Lasallia pustulata]|uniref:Pantoate--beta-alanine ligase n=1 Tax=Lasallia pustulata TaxID=136370 RepID=A0A1W5DAV3_9LECA|nr:pantoate-beta-alanine ligase [Lasallia pustulata]
MPFNLKKIPAKVEAFRYHIVKSSMPFSISRSIPELWRQRRELTRRKQTIGLVPTMGALHAGHISLIRQAARENNSVYVSIYVNPTQFGVKEDLNSYPRTWNNDIDILKELCQQFEHEHRDFQFMTVFAPDTTTMYPGLPPTSEIAGDGSFVTITPLATLLEGASRPVFFRGVATVVMKLLNIVQPDKVYFGQKDIQQTIIVTRMVEDFHVDTEVRVGPTIREEDGLAMSSRNVYLGKRRRAVGTVLWRALQAAAQAYAAGRTKRSELLEAAQQVISSMLESQRKLGPRKRALFEVDYISVAHPSFMTEVEDIDRRKGAVLIGAIKMLPLEDVQKGEDAGLGDGVSPVRLIDNIILQGEGNVKSGDEVTP